MLSTTAVPSSTQEKWRKMNNDWDSISRHLDHPRVITETQIIVTKTTQVESKMPDILVTQVDEGKLKEEAAL